MTNSRFLLLLLALAGITAGRAEEMRSVATNPFFAFCMDTQDSKKRSLSEQAQLLKELGYDGAGHLWLENISNRLQTLDAAGLKLFQIQTILDISPGKPAYDPRLMNVLSLLKNRHIQIDLMINGRARQPVTPANKRLPSTGMESL